MDTQTNLVSSNAMIAADTKQKWIVEKALENFQAKCNSSTFASILPAYAQMGTFENRVCSNKISMTLILKRSLHHEQIYKINNLAHQISSVLIQQVEKRQVLLTRECFFSIGCQKKFIMLLV